MEQRSEEWYEIRKGKVTASAAQNILTPNFRKPYMYKLISEILTGTQDKIEPNEYMLWGIEHEEEARNWYTQTKGKLVQEVGFCVADFNAGIGCSPDGLVNSDGLIEIKCPSSKWHIQYTIEGPKKDYIVQMQFQMLVTGRRWCDFVTYDPRMPESAKGAIHRVYRDEELQAKMLNCLGSMQKQMKEFLSLHGVDYDY